MNEELKQLLENAKAQGASEDDLRTLIDLYEADQQTSDGGAFVNFTEGSQEPQEQPSQPSEKSGDDQIYSIYNQLIGGGLTPDAAKGVLANIAVETAYTFDPTIEQQGGGPGRGLVQWESGGRFDTDPINLQSFAEENDRDWRDTSTQVDFILYELDNHPEYKKLKPQLNEADSTAATQLFLEKYEKAGKPKAEERKEALTRIDQALINKEGKPYAFELPEVSEDDYLASQRQKFEGEVSTFEAPIEYTEEKKKEIEERKNRISNMNASTYFETNEQIKQLDRQIEGGIPILSENVGQLADAKKKLEQEQRLGFIKLESETPTIENYDRVVSAVQEVKNTDRDDYNAVIDYADNYFAVMDGKVKEAIDSRAQSADPATSLDYMQTRDDAGRLIPDSDKIDATAKKVLKDLGLEGVDEKVDGRLSIGKQRLGKNIYQKIRDDLRTQVEGYIQSNAVKEKIKEEGKLKELKGEAVEKEFEKELELSAPRIQEEQQKLKDLEQRYGEKLESETASAYQKYVDAIFELDSKTKNQLASGIPEEGVMRAYRMEQKRLWNLYGDSKEAIQKDLNQRYVNRANQIVSNIDVLTQKAAQRAAKNAKLSEEQEKRAEEIYNTAYTDVLADREQDLRVYEGRVGLPAAAINTYASELGRSLGAIGRSTGIAPLIEFGEGMQLQTPYVAEDMEDWSDLFNISKLAKTTAKLGGSMTPSLIATAGATLATGGWGGLAAGAVAGWGIETLDMTGQIYRDVYEKTGSVMKAENAAEQMAEAQIRNMYLYSFEGLPFVGKALRGLGGVGRRVLAGAAIETGTEFAQEFTQTSQEKAIQETGTWKGYGKYMTGDEAKRTFLNIAPVALLGGGGQLVSARNEKIAGKKAYDAIKNTLDIAKVTPDARNQFLLRTYQEQGPTFTNAVIGGYYNNGMIDKTQYEEMRAFVNKQAPSLTSTGRAFGLSPEETVVYSSLTNHYNKLKEAAEAIENDDIAKGVALERANNFKKETEAYLNDPKDGGAFVAVQQGGTTGKMIYMSTAEFQDYISEPGVAQSIVNGDINFYARNIESEQIKKQIIKTLTGDAIARGIITESDKSEYQTAQEGRVSTKTSGSDSTIEVREEEVAPAVEEEEAVRVFVAPFYDTKVETTEDVQNLRESEGYKQGLQAIRDNAAAFGLEIESIDESVGGFVNEKGDKIREVSNIVTFAPGQSLDQLERFAAILGANTTEVQEATIAAQYVSEDSDGFKGDGGITEYSIKTDETKTQDVLDALKENEIFDFSFNTSTGEIAFLDFSKGTDVAFQEKIDNFGNQLENKGVSYEEATKRAIESRYIDPARRQELIREVEQSAVQQRQDRPQLYQAVSKAAVRAAEFSGKSVEEFIGKPIEEAEAPTDVDQELQDLEDLIYRQNPDVSLRVETVGDTREKVVPGQKVGRGLTKRKVKGETIFGDAAGLSIAYVKENNPKAFIKNANIIKDYPLVKGKKKFRTAQTVEQAQKIYDVFLREVADNLIYLNDRFETDLRDIATLWYDGANILAQDLSEKYGITPEQAAGMIASLSPQKDWYQNVRLAELVMIAFKENPVLTEEMIAIQREVADKGLVEKAKDLRKRKITQEKYDKAVADANETIEWLRGFVGQDLNSVPDEVKPYIVRLSNEAKGDKDYNILSPDGSVVGVATKKDGEKSAVAWGSYGEIGKAVSIYLDGANANISAVLGGAHKIRNFYNNIIDPNSLDGDVTMDTHAIAAALLLPLSGNSTQVTQNFGGAGTGNSDAKGHQGLYYAFSDAYALAAEELGLLPRQVQSITWEAVRGLYSDSFKRNDEEVKKVNDIWSRYEKNEITIEEARKLAEEAGGGITEPSWSRSVRKERGVSLRKEDKRRGAERARPDIVRPTERAERRVGAGVEDTYKTFTDILSKAFPGVEIIVDQDGFNEFKDDLLAMKLITKDTTVYGALVGNELYLNPQIEDYNTPIHEFGHVWLKMAKQLRPDLYQKGLDLVADSPYLERIRNSAGYKKVFEAQKEDGLSDAQIEELVREEALATAIGDRGESFVNAAKKKEFKTWLEKLFDFVRKIVGISKLSAEEVQNLTFQEFIDSVVADILSGETIFEGKVESDSLSMMAKAAKGDINQIVAKARENNFTDDVITRFLEKNGYKKGEIKEALEIKTDLFEAIPPAYGTAFGKNATSVYNKVKANLATTRKKADKSLQTGGGVKSYLSTYVDPAELEGYSKVLENPTINNIAKEYGKAIKTEEGKRTTKQKQLIYRVNQTINNSVGQRVVEFLQNQPEYKALEKNNEWSKTESLITETRDALGYKVRKTQKAIQDAINEVTGVTKPRAERIQVTANQLRSWAEKDSAMGAVAARKNQREIDRQKRQLRRDTVAALRDAVSIGKITTQQSVAIINKFDQINWANPASRQKFVEYFIKVAEKAENVANLQEASRLRKAIKKALKNKKKDAILRDSARRFASLDPTLVENIEDYLNLATLINQGLAPKKPAFNVNDVDIYSAKETERQEKFAEDTFRMSFENITGIDSKDLTVAEMKAMLSPEEVKDFSEQKKRDAKAAAEKLIEYYLPLAQKIASTNKDPFTGEELELEMGQADLIKRLANLDLTKLDTPSLVRVADTLNNFITNYKVGGLGTLVSEIETIEDVNRLANQGYKARELNIYWNKKLGSLWNEYLAPIPTVLSSMFGGVNRANKVAKALKFNRVIDGVAKTEAQAGVVFNALLEKYKGKKVAGEDFISDQNMIDVGMAGYAIRRPVTDNQEIIAEEFEKRTKNLLDSIEELRQQGDSKSLKLADLYEDAYNRLIKGAANAEEVKGRLNNDQRAFVDDMIAVFKSIKPLQDEVSLNVFNEVLGESENYLADVYGFLDKTKRKEAAEELIKSPTGMSSFTAFANSPMTKAGNFMKQTTPNGLKGTGKYVKLNLFENASQAYRNIMLDVNTAEDIRGMYAAMKSDAFTKLIPNAKDRELFKDRIDSYILNKKGKSGVVGNEDLNKALNYWAKIATTKALGSLAQVPKQYIPVMTNTVINLGADVDLLNLLLNEDANAFIERSNKAIANRGVGSLAAIESMNTLLDKGTYDNKLASFIESAGDFYLQNFLVNPDVSIARASWMAYYKQSLRKQGLSTDIDFKNDPINQEAADYAQSMVDRQQNVSDTDLQGKFFTSRETGIKVVRQMLFPFASFSTNQKARVFSDIATLNNEEATVEDKRIAARSLASTIAESVVFHSIGVGISALLYNLAAEMMGGDGDDDYIKRQLASRSVSVAKDILSPVPLFDPVVDATFNSILDAFGVEDGFRAYGRFSDLTNLDMGVYAIPIDRIRENLDAFDLAITGESGKKIISASDREAVTMAAIAMMLHNGGVLPADFQTVARNVIKQAKNKGKTQKQIEKSLRKRGGLRVSGRGL